MKTKIWIAAFLLVSLTGSINAQITGVQKDSLTEKNINPLKGLKKASLSDINQGTPVVLNPSATPMYYEDLSLIKEDDFMKMIITGDYIPEPYIDSNKVVKVFVLRKATEQEKKQTIVTQGNMQNKSGLIGKEAFPFSVTDIVGNNYSIEKLKGKVIVINFWFVECKPCIMEMPELNDLVDKYKGKEVVFLGFATNDKSKIENFLKTKTYKYNIIADCLEIAGKYEVNSYPTHLIIDKNSIISYVVSGLGPTTITNLDMKIESLLK